MKIVNFQHVSDKWYFASYDVELDNDAGILKGFKACEKSNGKIRVVLPYLMEKEIVEHLDAIFLKEKEERDNAIPLSYDSLPPELI